MSRKGYIAHIMQPWKDRRRRLYDRWRTFMSDRSIQSEENVVPRVCEGAKYSFRREMWSGGSVYEYF